MTDNEKFLLAGPEWIELAGRIVADVARQYGEAGTAFSVYEVFVDAPAEIADEDGSSCWCFYVDGKTVRSHPGRSHDVDLCMQATWELELPARGRSTPRSGWRSRRRTRRPGQRTPTC